MGVRADFPQKIKIELPYGLATSGSLSEENESAMSKRYLHPDVHCRITPNSQDTETTLSAY